LLWLFLVLLVFKEGDLLNMKTMSLT